MSAVPYIETAIELAKNAGSIMRENFSHGMRKDWKDDRSPVTETDTAINDLVLSEIKKAYPDHCILSEEGSDMNANNEFVWICDPVDGTHNFSHGIPTASFALALLSNGEPVLGVILDPFEHRLFSAEKGKGAFMNGERIHVSKSVSLKKTVIGLGKTRAIKNLFPVMDALYQQGVSMITGLSIHYMTALVAAGEFAATIFGGMSCHDMVAGKILVEEAGGRVTDLYGDIPPEYDCNLSGQVASNGLLHDDILSHIALGPDLKKPV